MDGPARRLFKALKVFLNDRFDLHSDKERDSVTIAEISKGVEFRGTNLWILIFAILVASIGLNVNSPAVIIGAMLISPLMGPIMGVGLGAGINDFELIKKSVRNLGVAVFISILTSTLYFAITPLHEAQSELLARVNPTLWDVLIAFFGGLAGIVAGSRKEKSNAIPGVAIATALMPPLCTAGYGLANLNMSYFAGALFLFCINSVFISVSTFLIVRFMRYPKRNFDDPKAERRVKLYISLFVFLTLVPSIYLAYNLVRRTLFEEQARQFITEEIQFPETQIIGTEITYGRTERVIDLTLYGKEIDAATIQQLTNELGQYGLEDTRLIIHQGYRDDSDQQAEVYEELTQSMRFQLIEDLYAKNEALLSTKDEQIRLLEEELVKARGRYYPTEDITQELRVQYPQLRQLSINDAFIYNLDSQRQDTVCIAVLDFKRRPYTKDRNKIEEWLRVRTKNEEMELVFR